MLMATRHRQNRPDYSVGSATAIISCLTQTGDHGEGVTNDSGQKASGTLLYNRIYFLSRPQAATRAATTLSSISPRLYNSDNPEQVTSVNEFHILKEAICNETKIALQRSVLLLPALLVVGVFLRWSGVAPARATPRQVLAEQQGLAPIAGTPIFINEIHYDNDGSDVGEGVEHCRASRYGPNRLVARALQRAMAASPTPPIVTLTGVSTDQQNSFGTAFFAILPMACRMARLMVLACIDPTSEVVIQFLS